MTTSTNEKTGGTVERDRAELAEARSALREAERHLVEVHRELLDDPRNDVESLDRAACSPYLTDLARLAMGASAGGITAQAWRSWITDGLGPQSAPLLAAAEHCMRSSGLWPWPE